MFNDSTNDRIAHSPTLCGLQLVIPSSNVPSTARPTSHRHRICNEKRLCLLLRYDLSTNESKQMRLSLRVVQPFDLFRLKSAMNQWNQDNSITALHSIIYSAVLCFWSTSINRERERVLRAHASPGADVYILARAKSSIDIVGWIVLMWNKSL